MNLDFTFYHLMVSKLVLCVEPLDIVIYLYMYTEVHCADKIEFDIY